MKKLIYPLLQTGATIAAAAAARKLASSIWRGEHTPPINPADEEVSWTEAAAWAALSGLLVGAARVVARRGTSAGWKKATGNPAPA
ncbi:MAG: DUF4235 domain-containing protein [Acidimicrobiales bacterium]